jgi:hypothetical protein
MPLKGQVFLFDIIVSISVFILIFLEFAAAWDNTLENVFLKKDISSLDFAARNAFSSILENSGNPTNWTSFSDSDFNETNVASIGLAKISKSSDTSLKDSSLGLGNYDSFQIDYSKLARLSQLNATKYETIKNILGIYGPNFEFLFTVKSWNGTAYNSNISIGLTPASSKNQVSFQRACLLDGRWAVANLIVWDYD